MLLRLSQARRNRGAGGPAAPPPPPQILAKLDLVPVDSNNKKKKGAKKYKPYKIPQKVLITLLLFT